MRNLQVESVHETQCSGSAVLYLYSTSSSRVSELPVLVVLSALYAQSVTYVSVPGTCTSYKDQHCGMITSALRRGLWNTSARHVNVTLWTSDRDNELIHGYIV